ncbi:MAG TPA: hypothetical protein VGS57_18735 [Thermoanaerobaculia bacterium]|jgi:hypothetical protein|nr:hypothetical protein [Thermoanaerobaculia bacterium]
MQPADIAVFDRQDRPVLIAEVKAKKRSSPEWAAMLRRNLETHRISPAAKYFLVATPSDFYFWLERPGAGQPLRPDFQVDTQSVLEPHLRSEWEPAGLSGGAFEILVASWLNSLVQGHGEERLPAGLAEWLRNHGVLEAMRGGHVEQH